MRFTLIFIIVFILSSMNLNGQTRMITGRVISEDLVILPQAGIYNPDSLLLETTDMDGRFRIEVPIETKSLLVGAVGMEWQSIFLPTNCNHFEVILINHGSYDFMSAGRVDRLRKQQFKKLPGLHQAAYTKGLFRMDKPCYELTFVPVKKEWKEIRRKRVAKPGSPQ